MALLTYVKARKTFIKIQEGTGDNLLHEDLEAGYVDYVLWSTFVPEDLELDQTLDMELIDSGMVMDKEPLTCQSALPACLRDAFGAPLPEGDVVVLCEG